MCCKILSNTKDAKDSFLPARKRPKQPGNSPDIMFAHTSKNPFITPTKTQPLATLPPFHASGQKHWMIVRKTIENIVTCLVTGDHWHYLGSTTNLLGQYC